MTLSDLTVACVGLGRMGSGIAANIQASGCSLVVYNRTFEKTERFVAAGARAARTPREAAATADIVVTSLMDDKSVLDTLLLDNGILAGMRPGTVHIGTSTISPGASIRCAELHLEQGSQYVAAPVAGRPDAAASAQLFTFVAGNPEVIQRVRPVLASYTQKIIIVGEDPAAAASMKLAGNFFGASLLEAIGEAFAFAEKRGVLAPLAEMLKGFLPMKEYVDRIAARDYEHPGFTLDAGLKDVRLILDAAGEVRVPLPFASIIRDKCLSAQAHGLSQKDWCAFTEISRLDAGG
jgi:3-hydroxyisobutyrate dehydrogenase-like beta-hydroxyacid dehydrogenase